MDGIVHIFSISYGVKGLFDSNVSRKVQKLILQTNCLVLTNARLVIFKLLQSNSVSSINSVEDLIIFTSAFLVSVISMADKQ